MPVLKRNKTTAATLSPFCLWKSIRQDRFFLGSVLVPFSSRSHSGRLRFSLSAVVLSHSHQLISFCRRKRARISDFPGFCLPFSSLSINFQIVKNGKSISLQSSAFCVLFYCCRHFEISQNCRAVFSMCLHVRSLPRRNPLSKDEKTPCRMTRQSLQSVLFPCLVSQIFCFIHLSRDLVSMILPFRFVKIIDYFMTNRILNTWRDLQVWQARNFYTLLYANGF